MYMYTKHYWLDIITRLNAIKWEAIKWETMPTTVSHYTGQCVQPVRALYPTIVTPNIKTLDSFYNPGNQRML